MIRIPLAILFALSACAAQSPPQQTSRPADDPAFSYGGLNPDIRVGGLTVRPLAVTEDSRCPVNVTCVWAGRLVLRLRVSGMAGEQVVSTMAPLELADGGALELASVTPARTAGRPGTPRPYRFGFRRR